MSRFQHFHLHLPDLSASQLHISDTAEKVPIESSSQGDIEKIASDSPPELAKVTSPQGVFAFLHPTHAHLHVHSAKLDWYSRDHRKGRHPVEHNKRRRITTVLGIEYWNVSWWVAFLFTLGSAVWTVNGFFVLLPSLNVMGVNNTVLGWTALVGGTIFELGSYLLVLEALNRKQVLCFGDACQTLIARCTHQFHNHEKLSQEKEFHHQQNWIWFGARWTEIGFLASATQLLAASVFWIATITGIPNVINMNDIGLVNGIFWVPQIIGGTGFVISSLLFMLETQGKWYNIRPFSSLGWHVGFWNLVGSIGFTLCGALGLADAHSWAAFQSGCATFWGSWAFLIGSVCQWVECLNR